MTRGTQDQRRILTLHGRAYETAFTRKFASRKPYQPKDPDRLTAIIPGLVLAIFVEPGQRVRAGERLLILEAMKMQNHITAPREGTLQRIHVTAGETVIKGQLLVQFEPMPAEQLP
jgi:biotin carboxyl carrier protein